ncbi:unnamed protein product [Aphanomyces euteiches]
MGTVLSADDGASSNDINILTAQEISAFYAKLSSKVASLHRVKTKATAADVLAVVAKQIHPLFVHAEPVVPFGRLSRANSVDSLHLDWLSPEEEAVKDLNRRHDHDTDELFTAIKAYQATCKTPDEFYHGLAHYRRAVKLWTHYLVECNHNLESIPHILSARAGVAAAKFAYRHRTLDARIAQLGIAHTLEESRGFDRQADLLSKQQQWDETLLCKTANDTHQPTCFVDRSVVETIFNLVALSPFFEANLIADAVQLAASWQVHPKQFGWTILYSCIRTKQCEILMALLPHMACLPSKDIVEVLVEAKQFDFAKSVADREGHTVTKTKLMESILRAQASLEKQPEGEPAPRHSRKSVIMKGSI